MKAFRWLGVMPGKGMLHIKRADGKVHVVPPQSIDEGIIKASIISDPEEFAALGPDRIAELEAAGSLKSHPPGRHFQLIEKRARAIRPRDWAGKSCHGGVQRRAGARAKYRRL